MVCIRLTPVSEELTKLMEKYGFAQMSGVTPYVYWRNLDGVEVYHHPDLQPRNDAEVIKLVYDSGFNNGTFEQLKSIRETAQNMVENFFNAPTIRVTR